MQTITTPPVHSKDEHAIVRLLSDASSKQAVAIQARLQELLGQTIWLQQPPSLHITLMEIICDTQYTGKSRQQYFEEWYSAYDETVKELLGTIEPFDVVFTQLLVSERAIIIRSAESETLNTIRRALLARTHLPPETKMPPKITHCTLARFRAPANLETIQRLTAGIPVHITEHVSEFSLVRDLGPPDFNSSPMRTYALRQG